MSDALVLVDGTQTVVLDSSDGVLYELAVRIDGAVSRTTHSLLGPALNALYAQALTAVLYDPGLGGMVCTVREGLTEGGIGLELELAQEAHSAPAAAFGLHLTIPYWQPVGVPAKREAILSALTAALALNTPGDELAVRERVIAAFLGALVAALPGVTVLRNADRPQRPGVTPIVVLRDGDQIVSHETFGQTRYEAGVSVEVFVAGSSSAALDAPVQLIQAAIRGAGHLGGLADDVDEADTDPEVLREAYTGACLAARLDAVITYSTAAGDPYTEASL